MRSCCTACNSISQHQPYCRVGAPLKRYPFLSIVSLNCTVQQQHERQTHSVHPIAICQRRILLIIFQQRQSDKAVAHEKFWSAGSSLTWDPKSENLNILEYTTAVRCHDSKQSRRFEQQRCYRRYTLLSANRALTFNFRDLHVLLL